MCNRCRTKGVPASVIALVGTALCTGACGLVGSSTSFADLPVGTGGGSAAGVSTGGAESGDFSDASCDRNPYLPDSYKPPCGQPKAVSNCTDGWCTIEPGCFIMGDSWCQWYRAKFSNDPVQVTLTRRFRVQQFELTQGQWTAQGLPNRSGLWPNGTGDCQDAQCPVGNVTWIEALAFANLISQNEKLAPCYSLGGCQGELGSGMLCDSVESTYSSQYDCPGYRLPTGAEWEYAARAGTKTTVYSGDVLDTGHAPFTCYDEPVLLSIAWYCANAGPFTHPVGQLRPNDFGLYDVVGNATEWTASETATYGMGPFVDWGAELSFFGLLSTAHATGFQTRGGMCLEWPNTLRVGNQAGFPYHAAVPGLGFRLVQTLAK